MGVSETSLSLLVRFPALFLEVSMFFSIWECLFNLVVPRKDYLGEKNEVKQEKDMTTRNFVQSVRPLHCVGMKQSIPEI